LYATLHLYIPSQDERDVQAKFSIQKTSSKAIGGLRGKVEKPAWKCWTWHFQCQCGIGNREGRLASKRHQIPWKNVSCLSWIKLVTTHSETDSYSLSFFNGITEYWCIYPDGWLLAIDEISGIIDHSDDCTSQIEME